MSVKLTAQMQCRAKMDAAARSPISALEPPPGGWIANARKALGMSAAQLGRKVGRTRANISAAERAEQESRATMQSMKTLAEAMGCRFVYAVIPADGSTENLLRRQALAKAGKLVGRASTHMALEKQALSERQIQSAIERLADELVRNPPPDFWDDT